MTNWSTLITPHFDEQTQRCRNALIAMFVTVLQDITGRGVMNGRGGGTDAESFRKKLVRDATNYILDQSTEEGGFQWLCDLIEVDSSLIINAVKTGEIKSWQIGLGMLTQGTKNTLQKAA